MPQPAALAFACPRCHSPLERTLQDEMSCPVDGLRFRRVDGIWRMLLPEREPAFAQFRREYETIRQAEGRGDHNPDYYRALPYRDLTGRLAGDWRVRAASCEALIEKVIKPFERRMPHPLRILDLGAGNGWLSNRLAQHDRAVAAVDLAVNDFDGLGCSRYYETSFITVQAEFDRLPFLQGSVDLVVFNASFHYSVDFPVTLNEARRVLQPAGMLVVMDSPVYIDRTSGARMVEERQAGFLKKYGFPSNSLPSENYLTYERLEELACGLGLHYRLITPFYGLGWQLRPLKARLLRRREPAKFHLIVFSDQE
jgi:SAM-dependent methyltransferase